MEVLVPQMTTFSRQYNLRIKHAENIVHTYITEHIFISTQYEWKQKQFTDEIIVKALRVLNYPPFSFVYISTQHVQCVRTDDFPPLIHYETAAFWGLENTCCICKPRDDNRIYKTVDKRFYYILYICTRTYECENADSKFIVWDWGFTYYLIQNTPLLNFLNT